MLKYLLILLATLLSSCESLVTEIPESQLPDIQSKLVVQSFISPQNTHIIVVVTESAPVYSESVNNDLVIRNAVVKLSDGENEIVIPFDEQSQLYAIPQDTFDIVPSKTYFLNVSDGRREVKASCTVPALQISPRSFVLDTAVNANADTTLTLKMHWQDLAGQPNYYRVRASIDIEFSIPDNLDPQNFKETRIMDHSNFNWDDTFGRDNFQSDANLDGTMFTSPTGRVTLPRPVNYDLGFGNIVTVYPKCKIQSLNLEVYNTDEHYFKYHRSLDANRNGDNPFVEPSLVYTNIEGGLGCFAAYNTGTLIHRPR